MDREKTTPEEKLLKIIEDPDSAQKRKLPPKEEISNQLNRLAGWYKKLHLDIKMLKHIDLHVVSRVIAGLCVVVTLFLVFDIIRGKIYFGRRFEKIIAEPVVMASDMKVPMNIDVKLEDALVQSRKHNMFTLIPQREKPIPRADISGPVELKLVGVLWSDKPQAMIENTREQKTYFVGIGDKIGVVSVKNIFENKVILSKDLEEWELR
jgi:type II secretory pathway component PulC